MGESRKGREQGFSPALLSKALSFFSTTELKTNCNSILVLSRGDQLGNRILFLTWLITTSKKTVVFYIFRLVMFDSFVLKASQIQLGPTNIMLPTCA